MPPGKGARINDIPKGSSGTIDYITLLLTMSWNHYSLIGIA